jgi:hypothetical protein
MSATIPKSFSLNTNKKPALATELYAIGQRTLAALARAFSDQLTLELRL